MDRDKTYGSKRVVLGKLAQGKGAARRPTSLFLSYSAKANLIQLTRSGTFMVLSKLEGLSGVMAEKIHGGG